MLATVRLVMLTAIRDRLFVALFALLALTTVLAVFLGGASISEQLQMAIVFAAGGGRLILVVGLAIFAAFHIQALFETREVEAILARAISRGKFVLAYWMGLAAVALVPALAFSIAVGVVAGFHTGVALWAISLMIECIVMLAVVIFAGLMLERATATVLFAIGFYILSRLMGFFLGIRAVTEEGPVNSLIKRGLSLVLVFMPRLDLFAQSKWLIYGATLREAEFISLQTLLFLVLVLSAAVVDLGRKQF